MKKIVLIVLFCFILFPVIISAGTWQWTGNLNQARTEHRAILLADGKVLVVGGIGPGSPGLLSSSEIYDLETETWSLTDSLNIARYDFDLVKLLNNKTLVIGGNVPNVGCVPDCELFDLEDETWSFTGPLNIARNWDHPNHATVLLPEGEVLVINGYTIGGVTTKTCEIYNPETEVWRLTNPSQQGHPDLLGGMLSNGLVLSFHSYPSGSQGPSAEIYDQETEEWTYTGKSIIERNCAVGTIIPSGFLLVGGAWKGQYFKSAEIYDQETGQWSLTDSLKTDGGRLRATVTLLPNNKVLIIGGCKERAIEITPSELYDLKTKKFQEEAPMLYEGPRGGRINHQATLLQDGRVLVTGGKWSGCYLETCQLYSWNSVPTAQVSGSNSGYAGDTLTFSIQVSDAETDSVSVRVSWGDGDTTDWSNFQPNGSEFVFSHTWDEPGEYVIKVQTRDIWTMWTPPSFPSSLQEVTHIHNSLSNWQKLLRVVINPVGVGIDEKIPLTFNLFQNYPNPFNSSTCISYQIPQDCQVRLSIFNLLGQEVDVLVNEFQRANEYVVNWQPKNLCSGIYIYQLSIESKELKRTWNKKLVIME
ncbi:MAG TPA: T9SS type A sorting domain-containing protein [Candidatus Marinimicrobia bacterium]|nr:T9SS type A sorting domain-containing protein [Candidatus Neomarinimicrobiota bacterium]